jgi:hypothetical protein
MLAELTDSLRRHIVWERQYKHSTANAVLKRTQKSNDIASLQQDPEPVFMMEKKTDGENGNGSIRFNMDVDSGYNSKGW